MAKTDNKTQKGGKRGGYRQSRAGRCSAQTVMFWNPAHGFGEPFETDDVCDTIERARKAGLHLYQLRKLV